MVDADGFGVADEGDVVDGLELGGFAVEDEELVGFGVGYPEEVCLTVVEEVSYSTSKSFFSTVV